MRGWFWKDDKMYGKGNFLFTDGDRFIGNFENGVSNGEGEMYYNNGKVYPGMYKDGSKNCYGRLYNSSNSTQYQEQNYSNGNLISE